MLRLRLACVAIVSGLGLLLMSIGCDREGDGSRQGGVVQLNVLMEPDPTGAWRELFTEFRRLHPKIQITAIEGPSATNTREDLYVTSFLSGQTTYDLVFADVVWIPKFAAAGWIEDLTDRWPAEQWNRFIRGSLVGGQYKGRIYRVPTHMEGGLLFYRSDLLAAAGESAPQTFEELVRIAKKLQNPDSLWGFVWQGKQYEGLVCDYLEILAGHGGTWIDVETGEVGLDSPPAIAALEFLCGCIDRWRISPPGVTTYTEEESRQLFHTGRAVFLRSWPYAWALSQRADSPVRGNVWMAPMPHAPGGQSAATLGGWGFAITSSSPHKEEAWQFIQYVSSLPQLKRMHEAVGAWPALKEFYEKSEDPAVKAIYQVLQRTVPRPPVPQYVQASDILQRYVSAALTGRMSPEEAMQRAARETRLLLQTSTHRVTR